MTLKPRIRNLMFFWISIKVPTKWVVKWYGSAFWTHNGGTDRAPRKKSSLFWKLRSLPNQIKSQISTWTFTQEQAQVWQDRRFSLLVVHEFEIRNTTVSDQWRYCHLQNLFSFKRWSWIYILVPNQTEGNCRWKKFILLK